MLTIFHQMGVYKGTFQRNLDAFVETFSTDPR